MPGLPEKKSLLNTTLDFKEFTLKKTSDFESSNIKSPDIE